MRACVLNYEKERICEEFRIVIDFISLFPFLALVGGKRLVAVERAKFHSRCNASQNPTLLLTRMISRDPVSVASCNHAHTHTDQSSYHARRLTRARAVVAVSPSRSGRRG